MSVVAFVSTSCKKEVTAIPEIPTCLVSEHVFESSMSPSQNQIQKFNYDSSEKLISTTYTSGSANWTLMRHYNETVIEDHPADSFAIRTTYNEHGQITLTHHDNYGVNNNSDNYERNVYDSYGALIRREVLNDAMEVAVKWEFKLTRLGGNIIKRETFYEGNLALTSDYEYDLTREDLIPIPSLDGYGIRLNKNLVTKCTSYGMFDEKSWSRTYQFDNQGRVSKYVTTYDDACTESGKITYDCH